MRLSDGAVIHLYRAMGLVSHVFRHADVLDGLKGTIAIGHNRYSTTGSSDITNAQPILIKCRAGQIAGAHNGNLTNTDTLRDEMENDGSIFTSTTDTEVVMHLIARSKRDGMDSMVLDALSFGAGRVFDPVPHQRRPVRRARPPTFRPLILGKTGDTYFLSSETCAFDLVGATMVREIEPGEMVRIDKNGIASFAIPVYEQSVKRSYCIFEYIYFSRPDSFVFGKNVDRVRRKLGHQLAKEHPAPHRRRGDRRA